MIPSKFGMAPINANAIIHHSNFNESTSTIFATPNNTKSNQQYISQLVRTADPLIPIQTERQDKILTSGMPKICFISFYPQGHEFFIIPIAQYFIENPVPSILSYFIVPEEPCNIYFECEDPNKLLQYLKLIPELSSLKLSAQIVAKTSFFVQLFCNFNSYCHIQTGNFVKVVRPEFDGDFAQIVSVDKENKRCLLKLIPRIDYDNLAKYHLTTQAELNDLMPVTYRPPKALFDKNKLSKINSNAEFGSKKINIDNNTEIELVVWSGKKFYGSFQYKYFDFESIKTIFPKISLDELDIFRKNIYLNEKFIHGFVETCEHLYSELINTEQDDDIEEIQNDDDDSDKKILFSAPSLKSTKKKTKFFPISSLNDLSKFEPKEPKVEPKTEPKPEKKSEHKSGQKIVEKSEHKSKSKIDDEYLFLPGTKVVASYGQYAGLICKVKSNDGKMITAEIDDPFISIPYQDFSVDYIHKEETSEIGVQVTPPEKPKPKPKQPKITHKSKTKTSKKHHADDDANEKRKTVEYASFSTQTEQENDIIPRENDLIQLESGETAMIVDGSNLLQESAGIKRKIKGAEVLLSTVIPDSNSANDSKGDRLSVNEEVKITKGRNSGEFARIVHISSNSIFVRLNGEIVSVDQGSIKKLKEDAQKVETEDIIGENIILLKNGDIASKPMLIKRIDDRGNIYVENTHNDSSVKKHFTVKMKDCSAKWMFEAEIPVEMRYSGSNIKKTKKKSSK